MGKTKLTLSIEKALKQYLPTEVCGIRINKFRHTHTAFEVPAECGTIAAGIVDAVRVQEYFGDIQSVRVCRCRNWKKDGARRIPLSCPKGALDSDQVPSRCDEIGCQFNVIAEEGTPKVLVSCYEIKVTKADFKSKNGHNFVGNLNYYVVPVELYPDIVDLVPEDIGIIVYYNGKQKASKNALGGTTFSYLGLRRKKECTYKPMTDEDQKWMVLSVMKRLEDTTWKERYRDQAAGYWQGGDGHDEPIAY